MKLVRRISLFMIALGLFVSGCFLGFSGYSFFYPGAQTPKSAAAKNAEEPFGDAQTGIKEVSASDENIITADTSFVVVDVNVDDMTQERQEIPTPSYYMGMNREEFESQRKVQDASPPLSELQRGYQGSEVKSFSESMVELYKFYQENTQETEEYFYLAIRDNRVVVYQADGETIYMETDIAADKLPGEVLQELLQKRIVNSEEDLYDFLEAYSS